MTASSRKNNTKWLIIIIYLLLFFALFLGVISSIRLNNISDNINQLSMDHDIERSVLNEIQVRFNLADTYASEFIASRNPGNLTLFRQSYADLTAFIGQNEDQFDTNAKKEILNQLIFVIADYEKAFNKLEAAKQSISNNSKDDVVFYASQIDMYKNDIPKRIGNLSLEVENGIKSHTIVSQKNINQTKTLLAILIMIMIFTGPLSGWLILRQTNERTKQQIELQEAQIEFEQRLSEQKTELSKANEETKQFAYIVSHDLRASLINLKGFSKELGYSIDQIHPILTNMLPGLENTDNQKLSLAINQDIPEAMTYINNSVNRMESFINAVLKLSRLGRRELELTEIDPNPLVEEIVANLTYQLEVRQGAVYAQNLPKIFADQTSMEQIFANILDNATKYWYPGRPLEIQITAKQKNYETIFAIKDNGQGIALEDMDKVFAPFRRIGVSQELGEGMGMAYVQAIVRNMGGRIWVESEKSKGTTIFFTIPINPNERKSHE